ncbi:hypothetical protein [Methylomagnum ishizawai]|uniref:hypothetical protein n=1 Tax=Methylomagnum ishizawai TaxID=1760988 RepID=UPI001C3325B1|nr:hypothetical protein [Methylomagnum ishizawai]BBL74182.1 hypothetical protein MishRS11D_12800 [Methylomagnum ishizawai]
MGQFLKVLLTGPDNQTWEFGRVMGFAGFVLLAGAALLNPFLVQPVDLIGLAGALGGYLTAVMAGIAIKGRTEPR